MQVFLKHGVNARLICDLSADQAYVIVVESVVVPPVSSTAEELFEFCKDKMDLML